jgi:hypothetical protein
VVPLARSKRFKLVIVILAVTFWIIRGHGTPLLTGPASLGQTAFDGMIMPVAGLSPWSYTGAPNSIYSTVWRGRYTGPDTERGEGSGRHPGVDIRDLTTSTEILAVARGTAAIVFRDWRPSPSPRNCGGNPAGNNAWGNYVVIEHSVPDVGKVFSVYAHLSSVDNAVQQGRPVSRGQVIGRAGTTGCSTGIHLHFQIDRDRGLDHHYWFGDPDLREPDNSRRRVADWTFNPIPFIRDHPPGPLLNVSGTWSGTWASSRGSGGTVQALISQSGASLSGTATVTGSPCFTSGSISGSVFGNNVAFGVLFGEGQQANFSATVGSGGTSMSGTYSVSGGACNGDTGSFNLTKQ